MFGGPNSTHSMVFDCPSLALALRMDLVTWDTTLDVSLSPFWTTGWLSGSQTRWLWACTDRAVLHPVPED